MTLRSNLTDSIGSSNIEFTQTTCANLIKYRILPKLQARGTFFSTPDHLYSFDTVAARCGRLFRSIYRPLRLLLRYERHWQCRNNNFSSHVNEFFRSAPKKITTILYRRREIGFQLERISTLFPCIVADDFEIDLCMIKERTKYNEDALFCNSVALFCLYREDFAYLFSF